MGVCSCLGTFFFNFNLALCSLPAYLFALIALCCVSRDEEKGKCYRAWVSRTTIQLACLGWRLALTLSPWVWVKADGLREFRKNCGSSGRPVLVMANHLCFLDTILAVALVPLSRVGTVKMLMAQHLFEIPVLRTVCRGMGHYAIPFTGKGMEVDKEKLAKAQQKFEDYVRNGGNCAWFPEGLMNTGDCATVGQFRAGGMQMPVRIDAEVWAISFVGNNVSWHRKGLGGKPAYIGVKIVRVCESTHQWLSEAASKGELQGDDEKAKSIWMANRSHDIVQAGVDELVAKGYSANPPEKVAEQPLLNTATQPLL